MDIAQIFISILVAAGIPAAIVGLIIRRYERKLAQREAVLADHEQAKRELEQFQIRTLLAVAKLCEATALAQQRGHCNGETKAALEYMQDVKRDMRDFLMRQGVDHVF